MAVCEVLVTMLYEDLRSAHEDIERLEQAIADRVLEDPKHVSVGQLREWLTELTTHRCVPDSRATMKSQRSCPEYTTSRSER